jgi:hypothetical protein
MPALARPDGSRRADRGIPSPETTRCSTWSRRDIGPRSNAVYDRCATELGRPERLPDRRTCWSDDPCGLTRRAGPTDLLAAQRCLQAVEAQDGDCVPAGQEATWWAWEALNVRLRPYQQSLAYRYATSAFLQLTSDRKRRSNALFERLEKGSRSCSPGSSCRGSHYSRCHGGSCSKEATDLHNHLQLSCAAPHPASSTISAQPAHHPPTNTVAITDASHYLALLSTPTFSEDSSAPRRQLDGGGPPAADGRGGGQTHP